MKTAAQVAEDKSKTPVVVKKRTNQRILQNDLRKRRASLRLTLKDVAEHVGVNVNQYHGYEMGAHVPSIHNAYRLAQFFECSVYDIFPVDAVLGDDE